MMEKEIVDYPIEDVFGDEILANDVYYKLGQDVVLEGNIKRYLVENHQVECFRAAQ